MSKHFNRTQSNSQRFWMGDYNLTPWKTIRYEMISVFKHRGYRIQKREGERQRERE